TWQAKPGWLTPDRWMGKTAAGTPALRRLRRYKSQKTRWSCRSGLRKGPGLLCLRDGIRDPGSGIRDVRVGGSRSFEAKHTNDKPWSLEPGAVVKSGRYAH